MVVVVVVVVGSHGGTGGLIPERVPEGPERPARGADHNSSAGMEGAQCYVAFDACGLLTEAMHEVVAVSEEHCGGDATSSI